ncbi:MAG: DUF2117 domain-containing protein [Methanobacteriaceae archaeon]|jgi:hypothetical protein|nr:DUF2117 domain-containing protein [Candidatus Methanorudis spinitermitis]
MKIGIVVHGPNIIDSTYALKIINLLKKFGDVKCRLGGTMGRTAVIDASLENIIDISSKLLPSESVKLFKQEGVDIIFLLNYGKSSITGHTFGFKVFKNSFLSLINEKKYYGSLNLSFNNNNYNNNYNPHNNYSNSNNYDNSNNMYNNSNFNLNEKSQDNITFIQIERPGENDGSVIEWTKKSSPFTYEIANALNLKVLKPETIIKKYFSRELSNKLNNFSDKIANNDSLQLDESKKIRNIHGVSPNENIFLNGVVIGKSTGEKLSIVAKNGFIVDIIGGTIKTHGVEKLGKVDIDKAIVKTGLLRKSATKPRIIANDNETNLQISNDLSKNYLKIAFIDHAAEDIYNLKNTDLVVTIGDDTTLVASDILFRFNIPVIGITDGDLDKVVEKGFKAKGSIIIELKPGLDDITGNFIFEKIFNSKNMIKIDLNMENDNLLNKNDLKTEKIENFKNQILNILNNITDKYKIKD